MKYSADPLADGCDAFFLSSGVIEMKVQGRCHCMPTYGGLYAWEFQKGKREVRVRVDGQLVCNTVRQRLDAALAGLGLAYMVEDVAQPHIASGNLRRVLADWCPPFSGYHLYYPSRRQSSPAFNVLVEALRYNGV